jgi:hypothetical protein
MPPQAKQVVKDTPMLLSDGKQIQTEYDHERKQHMTFATNQLAFRPQQVPTGWSGIVVFVGSERRGRIRRSI